MSRRTTLQHQQRRNLLGALLLDELQEVIVNRLADELSSGEWDRKYGYLRIQLEMTGALRLVVGYLKLKER